MTLQCLMSQLHSKNSFLYFLFTALRGSTIPCLYSSITFGNLQSPRSSNETLFFSARWRIIKSLSKAARSKYFAGFCFLKRGRIIAKKLDCAHWREALNTLHSLLAFAYFCSSSFRSRCKVQIFSNSGCLSFSLQRLTSWQLLLLHFTLLWPDV